jgi:hypothetical protein
MTQEKNQTADQSAEPVTVEVLQNQDAAISLITKAEIDSLIFRAQQQPRSLKLFVNEALSMATLNEDIADSCAYALPRGGKTVEGPSVRLAEIVAAAYGNLRTGSRVIYNDGKHITAQGVVHDLQKNILHTEEVQRSILQHEWEPDPNQTGRNRKTGKMVTMNEDMQTITGRAACAIAYRNAIFKVVPAALIQDIYEKVKETAKGTEQTLAARRLKAVNYFTALGVKDVQIYQILEVKGIEDIDLDKFGLLRGMCSAHRNGEVTLEGIFPKPDAKAKADAATKKAEDKLNKKTGNGAKDTTAGIDEKLKGKDGDGEQNPA